MNASLIPDEDILTFLRNESHPQTKGKKKKLTLKKFDIVWIIQVIDWKTGKFCKVTPSHLARTKEEHLAAGEELVGALGVVLNTIPKKRSTKLFLVYDSPEPESSLQVRQ